MDSPSHAEATKQCPYCAEIILAEAIKCKHCKEFLNTDNDIISVCCDVCNAPLTGSSNFCPKCGVMQTVLSSSAAEEEDVILCPSCSSSHISAQKKGFGLVKASVGGVLFGSLGLLGGFVGSRKIDITCLNCGHSWNPTAKNNDKNCKKCFFCDQLNRIQDSTCLKCGNKLPL